MSTDYLFVRGVYFARGAEGLLPTEKSILYSDQ